MVPTGPLKARAIGDSCSAQVGREQQRLIRQAADCMKGLLYRASGVIQKFGMERLAIDHNVVLDYV
jgi:hypothetical protein